MRTRLALSLLLISTVAAGAKRDAAEEAYQEARTAYYALKGDAGRRKPSAWAWVGCVYGSR